MTHYGPKVPGFTHNEVPMRLFSQSALAIAAVAAVLVSAGCSTGSGGDAAQDSDAPKSGGILKVLGAGEVDHLDPATISYVPSISVMRAVTRQLVSYATVDDEKERVEPKADLATEVPVPTNGGLTYSFTLRDGAEWNTPGGAREITSGDFVRGFKRLCNPALMSPMLGYFVDLIDGMKPFCDGFADVAPEAPAMREYIENNEISGLTMADDKSLQIDLVEPAGDFIYMLTLTVASPAPDEVLDYVPDSPEYRSNFISSGPYTVTGYSPDKSLTLERNPAWKADSDPLRKAYVDGIEVSFGHTNDAIMQQLQAGTADMSFDITPAPSLVQQLKATGDKKLVSLAVGSTNPFLWLNSKSPNNDGALAKLEVRQALQYAVDKAAVVQTLGGEEVAVVQNGMLGPGVVGYHEFDLYPTEGSKGDTEKAKRLLAEAGYPDGLHLKMPYRTKDQEPAIAQTILASMEKAGITIELIPVNPTDYYSKYLTNRETTAEGIWDIAPVGWTPDWQGGAARSEFQPEFTYTGTPQTYNYTEYNNDLANELAAQAIAASDLAEAERLWAEVDETIMKDAPIIPIASQLAILYRSERVGNFIPWALSCQGDWTNVFLRK